MVRSQQADSSSDAHLYKAAQAELQQVRQSAGQLEQLVRDGGFILKLKTEIAKRLEHPSFRCLLVERLETHQIETATVELMGTESRLEQPSPATQHQTAEV